MPELPLQPVQEESEKASPSGKVSSNPDSSREWVQLKIRGKKDRAAIMEDQVAPKIQLIDRIADQMTNEYFDEVRLDKRIELEKQALKRKRQLAKLEEERLIKE